MGTEAVKLSVMQELWFPILRNFTGLIMEKNEAIRNNAIDAFSSTLQAHHQHFGDGFWREIFGLVLLPVFEDIRASTFTSAFASSSISAAQTSQAMQMTM